MQQSYSSCSILTVFHSSLQILFAEKIFGKKSPSNSSGVFKCSICASNVCSCQEVQVKMCRRIDINAL